MSLIANVNVCLCVCLSAGRPGRQSVNHELVSQQKLKRKVKESANPWYLLCTLSRRIHLPMVQKPFGELKPGTEPLSDSVD